MFLSAANITKHAHQDRKHGFTSVSQKRLFISNGIESALEF